MSFVVAIDGPAAAGKGTISRAVAAHFGFAHLDTGLLYRAVGAKVLTGVEPMDAALGLRTDDLNASNLRAPEVAQAASQVAVLSDVRATLLEFQRTFARRDDGAVLDGRDIGTVICPDADVKLFVTARPEVRAERRFAELQDADVDTTFEEVLADVQARDARDSSRAEAPLKPAPDALLLDTSDLSTDAAIKAAVAAVAAARGNAD